MLVLLWLRPDDVSHCRLMPFDEVGWQFVHILCTPEFIVVVRAEFMHAVLLCGVDRSTADHHRLHSIRQPISVLQKPEFLRLLELSPVANDCSCWSVPDRVWASVGRREGLDDRGEWQWARHGVVQLAVCARPASKHLLVASGTGGPVHRAALYVLPELRPAVAVCGMHGLARRVARDNMHQHRRSVPQPAPGDCRASVLAAEAVGFPHRRDEFDDDPMAPCHRTIRSSWTRRTQRYCYHIEGWLKYLW